MLIEPGIRVVRGRDWCWQKQDGGEGFVGTVVDIGRLDSSLTPDKTVIVQWDCGGRTNYRIGFRQAFDLRVFDNSTIGVRHNGVQCAACRENNIRGMRWKCCNCADYDLCSRCYMADKHPLTHHFLRIEMPGDNGIPLLARFGGIKVAARGLFREALVVRGSHWDWGNQDGGEGKVGRILKVVGWETESSHSVARVEWASTSGLSNVYRVGHKGKVDLRIAPTPSCEINAGYWGNYYPEHLPLLGEREELLRLENYHSCGDVPVSDEQILAGNTVGEQDSSLSSSYPTFQRNDVVKIKNLSTVLVKRLQENHGGWNERMTEYIGQIGYVHRITERGDVRVQFSSCNNRWTFHPQALHLIVRGSMDSKRSSSSTGTLLSSIVDKYSIVEDPISLDQVGHVYPGMFFQLLKSLVKLRQSLGSLWRDDVQYMIPYIGIIVEVRLNERQIRALFLDSCGMVYHMESFYTLPFSSCILVGYSSAVDSESHNSFDRMEPISSSSERRLPLQKSLELDEISGPERLVYEATHGTLDKVRKTLNKYPDQVDKRTNNKTALQVASHEGHVDIVKLLLSYKACLSAVDEEGDSPLHYACFGNQPIVAQLLLEHGADVDAVNKSLCTPLHVSVNKQHVECVRVLLQHNANVNKRDSYGDPAIHDAIGKGNESILSLLLNSSNLEFSVHNKRQFNCLHQAALKGNVMAARMIVQCQPQLVDVRKPDGFGALHLAALNGHSEVVRCLLDAGADSNLRNNKSQTSLMLAASQGHLSTVVMLLEEGCSADYVDDAGNCCLHSVLLGTISSTNGNASLRLSTDESSLQIKEQILQHLESLSNADLGLPVDFSRPSIDENPYFLLMAAMFYYGVSYDLWSNCRNQAGKTPREYIDKLVMEGNATYSFPSSSSCDVSSQANSCVLSLLRVSSDWSSIARFLECYASWQRHRRLPPEAFCVICSDDLVDVTFEPCGHRVSCADCCMKMRRCIKCQQTIVNKKKDDGSIINSLSTASLPNSSDKNSSKQSWYTQSANSLRERTMHLEDIVNCDICMDRPRGVAFQCGHTACTNCSQSLQLCHMCRKPILQRINLFFASTN